MKLETKYFFEGITITNKKENDDKIISKSVKITNKTKQRVQKKLENVENNFLRVAQIERKKDKKQNFFNKHKK
jgi:hypothetical protein